MKTFARFSLVTSLLAETPEKPMESVTLETKLPFMRRRLCEAVARAVERPLDGLEGRGVETDDPGLGEPGEDPIGEGVGQGRSESGAFDARFQFQAAGPLVAGGAGLIHGEVLLMELEALTEELESSPSSDARLAGRLKVNHVLGSSMVGGGGLPTTVCSVLPSR